MTGDQVRQELAEIEPTQFRRLAELARRISGDSRAPGQWLARAWASPEADQRRKARAVLVGLRELAIGPWLAQAGLAAGVGRIAAVDCTAQAYLAARQRVTDKLARMMQSKAAMPAPPPEPGIEEEEPPSRACDEAYLLARRLLRTGESELVITLNRSEFLRLDEGQRDAEIERYTKTDKWAVLVDWDPDEG